MSDHRPTHQCPCGCTRPGALICAADYRHWPCPTVQAQTPLRDRITAVLADHETDPDDIDLAGHRSCSCGKWNGALGGTPDQHRAAAIMDVLANRVDTPDGGFDPRTEVEAHSGDPEQIIAVWETDQAERRAHTEAQARHTADLEEENRKLRTYLGHATAFEFGAMDTFVRVTREQPHDGGPEWFVRSWGPTERHTDVLLALARARELAGE